MSYHVFKTLVLIESKDRIGIVSDISQVLANNRMNILLMREFVDVESSQFFARIECESKEKINYGGLFEELTCRIGSEGVINVLPLDKPKKIIVLVTKEFHCLADILIQNFFGLLGAEICCVVGNRPDLFSFTEKFSIPFFYIPFENKTQEQNEEELLEKIIPFKPDFIILAKFMRILSEKFISHFPNRIINIHHSFLPAFKGANPYKQAYSRGVKIIGATAHFVTRDLDDGPIISQETIHVNHNFNTSHLKEVGKTIERNVLNKALHLILADKVFIVKNRTVIFE